MWTFTRISVVFALLTVGTGAAEGTTLRLVEWNIRGGTWNQAGREIMDYLLESGAGIIAIQEARRAINDLMTDPAFSDRYELFQPGSDNPILVDRSLGLTVSGDGPSGVGTCSEGTVATIELPGGASFRLFNSHFCFGDGNATDGDDLLRVADPANSPEMILAPGDLNTSPRFSPETIEKLLSSGFVDTWEHTQNPDPKPDVLWILANEALVNGASLSNTRADDSCTANTSDGSCSDHQAFFVDIEFGGPTGGLTADPAKRRFGDVEVGKAPKRRVKLTNNRNADVDIFGIEIAGRDASQFSLPSAKDHCSGKTLRPGKSCRFKVRFEPERPGLHRARAVVESSDPDQRELRVKLRGTGVGDLLAGGVKSSSAAGGQEPGELVLINGKILTMDGFDRVVSGVKIRDGRFVEVGDDVSVEGFDGQVIDLGGRTVTPGLIDTHIHYYRDAHIPGHLLSAIERVFTIPDLLDAVTERAASVPAGEFVTVLGRFDPSQFAENRLPTLEELDGAAPSHPVYLQTGFDGPAVTNTLGREYFEAHGLGVNSSGTFDRGQADVPVQALFDEFTNDEALRTVEEYMRFSASLGLTMVQNYSGCGGFGRLPAGTLCAEHFLDLWRRAGLLLRIRTSVGGTGTQTGAGGLYQVVLDTEDALQELEDLGGGDDMLDFATTGEFVVGNFGSTSAPFEDAYRQIAERGWSLRQHSISPAENEAHIAAFEAVDSVVPIAEMRWAVEHVFSIGADHIGRLDQIGAGATVQNQQYLLGGSGPPYRDLLDSGISMSAGTDASAISPMSPWISLYHMVTGRDVSGRVVNAGQQITRLEALRIYTTGGAWHTFEEEELGSIEVGKLADLVVLSDDYLSVPDQEIRTLSSVLTLVGGKIVHSAAEFVPSKPKKPKKLRAAKVASTQVNLRWRDRSDNEDSFEIQMKPPGARFATAAIVGTDVRKVTITGLTPATTYKFRVRARAGSKKSKFSNKLKVTTVSSE